MGDAAVAAETMPREALHSQRRRGTRESRTLASLACFNCRLHAVLCDGPVWHGAFARPRSLLIVPAAPRLMWRELVRWDCVTRVMTSGQQPCGPPLRPMCNAMCTVRSL